MFSRCVPGLRFTFRVRYHGTRTWYLSATEMPNTVPLTLWPIVELTSSCSTGSVSKVKTNLNLHLTKLRQMSAE